MKIAIATMLRTTRVKGNAPQQKVNKVHPGLSAPLCRIRACINQKRKAAGFPVGPLSLQRYADY